MTALERLSNATDSVGDLRDYLNDNGDKVILSDLTTLLAMLENKKESVAESERLKIATSILCSMIVAKFQQTDKETRLLAFQYADELIAHHNLTSNQQA